MPSGTVDFVNLGKSASIECPSTATMRAANGGTSLSGFQPVSRRRRSKRSCADGEAASSIRSRHDRPPIVRAPFASAAVLSSLTAMRVKGSQPLSSWPSPLILAESAVGPIAFTSNLLPEGSRKSCGCRNGPVHAATAWSGPCSGNTIQRNATSSPSSPRASSVEKSAAPLSRSRRHLSRRSRTAVAPFSSGTPSRVASMISRQSSVNTGRSAGTSSVSRRDQRPSERRPTLIEIDLACDLSGGLILVRRKSPGLSGGRKSAYRSSG
ncbi:hypothetical protein SAMN06265365_10748 [Tistlia consotensis]|uniref:Uncharacterized protein n=1 Tax=Tistlia consotensis USBA 355 TaxID=560819 RepID=A0A1Y6BE96_9PROT|nr:hypothetical protein SAMN05428998_10248 [Tistlia consotensis USBA 355]SNR56485.1 hypothetical protein SAMN06265365_10748 [Tistlia consotensis]